jgi:GDP-4-dehydro-6-deoxy-D-mannose reductase
LITGASGFVGGHLGRHLSAAGDEVAELDRHTGVDILDLDPLVAEMNRVRPDVVYHLAAWSHIGRSWSAPAEVFRVNAEGTLNVLLAAGRVGAGRVLVVSSADIYGPAAESEMPLTEESPLRPASPYGVSKAAADLLGLQAWLGNKLEVVRIRAFNHHGPGQLPRFVTASLAESIARNEVEGGSVLPVGSLSTRRDFTDVRDVVRAYRKLAEHGEPGEAYNVCSGVDVSVSEIADRLIGMAARPMRLEFDPARARPVDVPVLRGDNSKLRAATGWAPEIPLDTTLADVLDDARRRARAADPRGESN